MKLASVAVFVCAFALLAGSGARASVPGNQQELANEGLLHVCRDLEPGNPKYIVCDEQVDPFDPQSPYTASECTAAGLAASCRPDLIPGVRIPARLTLIGDEHPLDGFGDPVATTQSTLILKLTFDSKQVTLIESFDGTKIGNWNAFAEFEIVGPNLFDYQDGNSFQFTNGNLVELGLRIRQAAQECSSADLSDAVPVLVKVERGSRDPVDASAPDDELASASYYRIQIRFARVRP
jgi:hypothetical protein